MKSIEARFMNLKEKNPGWGSYICIAGAMGGQNFSKNMVRRWFFKLMPKDEYLRSEAKGLINCLTNLSNPPEDDILEAKFLL